MARGKFESDDRLPALAGRLLFVLADYAFNFVPRPDAIHGIGEVNVTSFLIGTLQLEVNIDRNLCLFPWGYCPTQSWTLCELHPPEGKAGGLRYCADAPLHQGVSVGLPTCNVMSYDRTTGWFCAGEPEASGDIQCVEFASDCCAVICNGSLVALWLRPT